MIKNAYLFIVDCHNIKEFKWRKKNKISLIQNYLKKLIQKFIKNLKKFKYKLHQNLKKYKNKLRPTKKFLYKEI